MKKLFSIILITTIFITVALAQLTNDGAIIIVLSGTELYTVLDIKNTNSGGIVNAGAITTTQSLENQSGCTVSGDGTYTVTVDWTNSGTFTAGTSTVEFTGSGTSNVTSGGDAFNKVEVNKDSGNDVALSDDMDITNDFDFTSDNNKVQLGTFDLRFGTSATISNFDNNDYLLTDGTGEVKKDALATFTFPVGFNSSTYNPVTLIESGTADKIGVRCLQNVLDAGTSGSAFTSDVVDASWVLTEATGGGSDLSLTPQWAGSDELSGFDRSNCGIAYFGVSGWDLTANNLGNAAGADPFTTTKTGISDMGAYAIGGKAVAINALVAMDILLEGNYSGSGLMNDNLRTSALIPTTEPYSGLGFTQKGFGGGETTTAGVLTTNGSDAIVDWVFVEIRDGSDNSIILATKAALLQADGDIVDTDGTSDLKVPGIGTGSYFVVVKHRNHLGVMTAFTLSLSAASTSYDFTLSSGNTFGGTNGINSLDATFFGLFSGDFDSNGQVQNTDATGLVPTIGSPGYLPGDLDLNGQVQNSDLQLNLYPNLGRGVQFPN